ncbi:response regulator [Burkholderia sp. Bp8963]|uniref:response regulator n=1 Tax=Burkholderia sp. Bp8963 TaxID=2184547 RepID=UPI000F590598|nr:response regulator [Burkholderia sp. Bp8963]RQS65085.1 response regulator [Burkholderia sp. Bp8963]
MSEPAVVVVVVDDDRFIRHFVHAALKAEHMHVCEAATGAEGVAAVAARRPDLIVADISLPDLGGVALIHALRDQSVAPLIVLSALSTEADKVAAHGRDPHYLRVYVGHLRRKLERDPGRPEHILTETGVGYRLTGADESRDSRR